MAVKGIPVIIVESGGVPVRPVEANYPLMSQATNGQAMPITISDFGAPFVIEDYDFSALSALSADDGANLVDDDAGVMETYIGNSTS